MTNNVSNLHGLLEILEIDPTLNGSSAYPTRAALFMTDMDIGSKIRGP